MGISSQGKVLVVDGERYIGDLVSTVLDLWSKDLEVDRCQEPCEVPEKIESGGFSLVIVNVSMPLEARDELLAKIRCSSGAVPILLLSSNVLPPGDAERFMPLHVLRKPFTLSQLRPALKVALPKLPDRPASLREDADSSLVGSAPSFLASLGMARTVAATDATVLLLGPSGSGKTRLARKIHEESARRHRSFVKISGSLPETLIESELFGYEKGAHSTAVTSKTGLLEAADGGTIFLEEVESLSPGGQVKLLEVLQERTYRRLGSTEMRRTDVRIIAATSANLLQLVQQGKFREDLYYRLNVVVIGLPALAERREDIPLLAEEILRRFADKHRKGRLSFSSEAFAALATRAWPGNVRELENAIERMVSLANGKEVLGVELLPPCAVATAKDRPRGNGHPKGKTSRFTREQFVDAISGAGGNLTLAQERLGIAHGYFYRLLHKFGLI